MWKQIIGEVLFSQHNARGLFFEMGGERVANIYVCDIFDK